MPKILIAECKQEVSTFNPIPSGYDLFSIYRGRELAEHYRGTRAEMGGALAVFEADARVEIVSTYGACMKTCGGTLTAEAWDRIAGEFVAAIRDAGPVDAVYFSLHGAMASENEGDPEGWLLEQTRRVLGAEVPIVVSLDLHGIVTDRLFELSDAVVALHTYPHVDFYETGARAAALLLRILRGEVRPVSAKVAIPALVRGDELITATGAIRPTIRAAQAIEATEWGLSAGVFIGNPFTDVPDLQSYTFVVADNDPTKAQREAMGMAEGFWAQHEKMRVPLVSLDEMVAQLHAVSAGTVALVDAADATSSGASGDSNAILRKLMESGSTRRVLLPLVDAPAVQAAFSAGVGARLEVALGGTLDPTRFQPLRLQVEVRLLADGRFPSESWGGEWDSGPTAVLQADHFTIVATTRPVHLFDRSLFLGHGQDPARFDAVVVKSPHCQPHMYQDWCARMIHVDAPGSTSANLRSLGHTRCPRPMFPLDANVSFTPEVKLYQRLKYAQD